MSISTLENRYMEFMVGDEKFALPLMSVKEVIQATSIKPIPNMPLYFEGIMNLRGQTLGIFSAQKKLYDKASSSKKLSRGVIIIVEHEGKSAGMLVDEVTRVIMAKEDQLQQLPNNLEKSSSKLIKSTIKVDADIVLEVDVVKLLELDKEFSALAS